jgi:hypothetical protein
LKQIKDGKDMAKTRFMSFSVKKHGSRGLSARNQGLKRNYANVYSAKDQVKDLGWDFQRDQGLRYKRNDLSVKILIGGRTGLECLKRARAL